MKTSETVYPPVSRVVEQPPRSSAANSARGSARCFLHRRCRFPGKLPISIRICLWKPFQTKIMTANWIPKLCFLPMIAAEQSARFYWPPPPRRRGLGAGSTSATGTDGTPIFIFPYVKFRHNMDKRLQPGRVSRPASARLLPTFPDRGGRGEEGGGGR